MRVRLLGERGIQDVEELAGAKDDRGGEILVQLRQMPLSEGLVELSVPSFTEKQIYFLICHA